MSERKQQKFTIDRVTALQGRPEKMPPVGRKEANDKLNITIEYGRPRWQRFFGAERLCSRTFELDAYGREVYEYCDGKTPAEEIIRKFARNHKISVAEAELSVAKFMKTLVAKGLIAIAVDRKASRNSL